MPHKPVIIVGAGHAGVQVAASLREEGYADPIVLLSDEDHLPYQRPPLSKAFLKGTMDADGLPLKAERFFRDHDVALRLGVKAQRLDSGASRLELADGGKLEYSQLVLATGSRAREFLVPGADLSGVFALRNLADAKRLRVALAGASRVVVVGAGFIGLEIAATARALGADVTIAEIAPRPMGRALSSETAEFFRRAHEGFGSRFLFGQGVAALHGRNGAVEAVELADGERLSADVVVVGVGVTAEDSLARAAGISVGAGPGGVVVDSHLTSSVADISAVGDCALFPAPWAVGPVRLESVQNATDQARNVARKLVGKAEPYVALPWFWSDQGDLKLQIVGLSHGVDRWVLRGEPEARAFSCFGFRGETLAAVESVNKGGEHMAARRILSGGLVAITPAQAADPNFDLRAAAAPSRKPAP